MPGYSFLTKPDGTVETVVNGEVYKGNEPPAGVTPKGGGGGGGSDVLGNLFGSNPLLNIGAPSLRALNPVIPLAINSFQSLAPAATELIKTGNIGAAFQSYQKNYAKTLETNPLLTTDRIAYNAVTGLITDISNTVQAGNRRPGQAASPLFGLVPPPPKAKSQGAVEDFITELLKAALIFIPASRGISLGAGALGRTALFRGASTLPGISQGVATVQTVRNVPAAMRTAAAATEGIGGVPGALRVGAKALEIGGRSATQGAAAGAVTDFIITPAEQTTASQLLDLATKPKTAEDVNAITQGLGLQLAPEDAQRWAQSWSSANKQADDVLRWVDSTTGSALHEPLRRLVLSDPNDTEIAARWKNSIAGLGLGAGLNATFEMAGLAARAIFHRARLANQVGDQLNRPAAEPTAPTEPPAPGPTPAGEQVVDVKATQVPQARREPQAPGVTQATGEPPLAPQATVDLPWRQGGGIQRNLQPAPGAGTRPAATAPTAAPAPAPLPDPWGELAIADQQVVRATDEFATQAARVANTVPDEMGPIGVDRRGGWLPAFNQVREESPANIGADPVRLQFKAEGRLTKSGESGSLKDAERYEPFFGKIISVWRDPATGELLVVNGHNRLALAKRSGADKVLVWEIEAKTAEEARAIGAMENIVEGQGTAWDAGKILRDTGMSIEEIRARGIDVKGTLASQGLALSRLPDNVFTKGVIGELTLEKALALGSEPLDEALIRDVYNRAVKGKWSASKITQAMQEAKFGEVRVEDGGTLPGMGEWFKVTNFNELLDVRTEAFAQLRKEVTALTAAADPARTGYLEGAGNVIDVAGSRAQRDKAKAAADLFNRIASSEGPVRDLLKEMAGLVSKKRTAAQLVQEYLPRLRDAIEADVRGPRLPFVNAPGAPMPMAEALRPPAPPAPPAAAAPAPAAAAPAPAPAPAPGLDPADIAALRDTSGLAPEDAALINEIADLLEGMDKATTETLATARKMLDQAAAIEELMPATPDAPPSPREEAIRRLNAAFDMPAAEVPTPGTLAGVEGAIDPEVLGPEKPFSIADAFAEQMRRMAESDARLFGAAGQTLDVARTALNLAESGPPAAAAAPAPAPAPAPAVSQALPDTRGQGAFFHGAAGEVELRAGGEYEGDGMNIYGEGFYATDDAVTASKYKKKNAAKGAEGVVYQVREKRPIKFFDLDAPAPREAVDLLRAQGVRITGELNDMGELIERAIEEAGDNASLAAIMDEMRGWSREYNIPAHEIQESWEGFKVSLEGQGYGGFTHQGGRLAGRGKRLHQVRIYWNPAESITIEKYAPAAAAPQPPAASTVTRVPIVDEATMEIAQPILLTQDIVIPEKAMRPLDPGSSRVQTVSQSIARWLGISNDEARSLLLAKGQVLDVDKIAGMDLDKALNDAAMGMTTPETQAIARAYEQFYGPSSRQQRTELQSVAKALSSYMPNRMPKHLMVSPTVAQAAAKVMTDAVRMIAGDDIAIRFNAGRKFAIDSGAHGQKGQMAEIGGGYGFNENEVIQGDPVAETMDFHRMALKRTPSQTDEEFMIDKLFVAAHESFHAAQLRYMSSKQLRVMNTAFAKLKLALAYNNFLQPDKPIEKAAQAFEEFYPAYTQGAETGPAMLLSMDAQFQALVKQQSGPRADLAVKTVKFLGGALIDAIKVVDDLTDFMERLYNTFRWRGWTSIRDIFEQAAAGDLKKTGALRGHVMEINDIPGKMTDYMRAKYDGDKEWGRRLLELRKQGIPWEDFEAIARNEGHINWRTGLYQKFTPEPPQRGIPGIPDVDDPAWQKRWATLLRDNAAKLASGEITREELYMLNHFEKPESPSGRPYTAKSEELLPGLAAMSQVLPDRPTESGIPVMDTNAVVKSNQEWFDRHREDGAKILAGLDAATKGFAAHEHGALNRAMAYADKLQIDAQIEAAKWLNSVDAADPAESLARMIAAADKARRMHRAIMKVTRPWGQMGLEMQLPRNYEIPPMRAEAEPPAPAGEAFPAKPEEIQPPSVVDEELARVLAPDDQRPEAVFEDMTDLVEPELTEALKGGEFTPKAQAAADDIASFLIAGGVDPSVRAKTWVQLEDLVKASPKVVGSRINGNSPLQMLLTNNLISSGVTANTNFSNGIFNGARLMGAQAVGSLARGDMERAMYAGMGLARFMANISTGFRLAAESFRVGEPLTNLRSSAQEDISRLAAMDIQGELLKTADPNARTGWTITSMDMAEPFANSFAGKTLNALWQLVGTGASRLAISIDTFNSTMWGHTYEHFQHMPRGMQLAGEKGLKKFSPEAWDYANKYAQARVDAALKDAIIKGRTITDAILDSPNAQHFMNAVSFTDDIMVELAPRSLGEGLRLGVSRGLQGEDLTRFAKQYVEEGNWRHKLANGMMEGFDVNIGPVNFGRTLPLGRIGSVPGATMQALANAPVVGPVFRMVQPFIRTPANIIKSAMRSTPAAGFVDSFWRDIVSEDPATRQRAAGEVILGASSLMLAVVATQMGNIRINGAGPVDPLSKENWARAGRLPYSIQFWDSRTNTWSKSYQLTMLEPYTTLFGMIGDYNDVAGSVPAETQSRMAGTMTMELLKMQAQGLLSKTYFQGFNNLYEAAFDPNKTFTGPGSRDPFVRFFARMTASFVPYSSAMRAARRQVDPIARSVDPGGTGGLIGDLWKETIDEIRNATPGFSAGLAPRRDWTLPGSPPVSLPQVAGTEFIPESAPFLAGAMQFAPWSSVRANEPLTDAVQKEMAYLYSRGTVFSGPRAADFGLGLRLTSTELSQYQQIFGSIRDEDPKSPYYGKTWHQAVTDLINDPNYQALPIEPPSRIDVPIRAVWIQMAIARFKEIAKKEFMATPGKGAQIKQELERRAGRAAEEKAMRQYGVPGASDAVNFTQEMNR